MKNIYIYISLTISMLLLGTIHSNGQIVKVSLSGNNLCNNYLEVGIYVRASDFSTVDFEMGSTSFFFNYDPAIASFVSYTPVEFNETTSTVAAGANWIDQAISNDGECGLLSLVLQKEDGGANNYELNKVDMILVGTVLMQFVNGEADPDIRINDRFTLFNSDTPNDGTAMIPVEDYPKVQNYTCSNNCTPAVVTNISTNSTSCSQSTGLIAISFPDHPTRTGIEFSLDGGFTFPFYSPDDVGTYEIVGLSAATFDLWVRWGDDSCPYNLGPVSINAANGPNATLAAIENACGSQATGSVILEFLDDPNRTNIEFSLDGGLNYPYTSPDDLLALNIPDLAAGTYDLWVRWGNDECPVDMGNLVIYANDQPEVTSFRDYDVCDANDLGSFEFEFEDHPSYSNIQFSIDGGLTYPYTSPDNVGTYTIDGLALNTYAVWSRWDNGNCPIDLGSQTLSIKEAPIATIIYESNCISNNEGELVFNFPDNADRGGIQLSIDGGQTYQYTADDVGIYTFNNLPVGIYDCWVRWGDNECPTFIEKVTLATSEITENGDFSNLDEEWDVYINAEATADYLYTDQLFSVDIIDPGSSIWHTQLIQYDVPIVNGHSYQITFKARADAEREMLVQVAQNGPDDYSGYYNQWTILTQEWQSYTYNFVSDSTDAFTRLNFHMGIENIDVQLDDISMIDLDDNIEVVKNGNFDNGGDFWSVYVNVEAEATHDYVDELFSIDVIDPGSLSWHVQLIQHEVPIIDGHNYQVSFRGRSEIDRQIRFYVAQNGPDIWTAYFYDEPLLTEQWQSYTYTFTSDSTDAYARLVFDLGLEAIDVQLDDVEVIDLDCGQTAAWVTPQLCLALEGPYDAANDMMNNTLQQTSNLPDVQPYSLWGYEGNEGLGWTAADYPAGTVDWVLVSFRTGPSASTEIAQTAAILQQDGCLFFPNPNVLSADAASAVYVVVEHRNHIAAMTPSPVNIVNTTLTYDFRLSDGYNDAASSGQKQLANGTWAMFAGDCDQSNPSGYDINGQDKAVWEISNGFFNDYFIPDINMDGDVNGADKALWNGNNGIFSSVPK